MKTCPECGKPKEWAFALKCKACTSDESKAFLKHFDELVSDASFSDTVSSVVEKQMQGHLGQYVEQMERMIQEDAIKRARPDGPGVLGMTAEEIEREFSA